MPFGTYDHNDAVSCSVDGHGAWWYNIQTGKDCQWSDLNGLWGGNVPYPKGINWKPLKGFAIKKTAMKMRPAI